MRISFSGRYSGLSFYQQSIMSNLNSSLNKMSTGSDIKFGYENSTAFNKALIMDNAMTRLTQTKELASNANYFTRHTDTALTSMTELLEKINYKMVQATTNSHDMTSLLAIASDLRAYRSNLLAVANTAVGGEYLFAGSALTRQPFGADGSYYGNDQELHAVLGDNYSLQYNITGLELFFGMNRDHNKEIVTNVKHYNQSMLNPGIMDKTNRTELSKEVYITAEDTLRDLIGDDDWDTTNNEPETFYIQGVRPDGTSFKAKFSLDINYTDNIDKKDATKVQDLLDKIGEAYGNTSTNKVVDVTINEYGAINIKDLTNGRSNLDFYMVSSNRQSYHSVNGELADENDNTLEFHTAMDTLAGAPAGTNLGTAVANLQTGQYEVTVDVEDENGNIVQIQVPVTYEKDNVYSYINPNTGKKEKLYTFVGNDATPPVRIDEGIEDLDQLTRFGARVTTYVQSNFLGEKNMSVINSIQDSNDHRRNTLSGTFRTENNVLAQNSTRLIDVLGAEALEEVRNGGTITLTFGGTQANTNANPPLPGMPVVAGAPGTSITIDQNNMHTMTMQDLMSTLENVYGGNDRVKVELVHGKITLVDQHVTQSLDSELPANRIAPYDGASSLHVTLSASLTPAGGGAATDFNVFANDYTVEYDRVQFKQNGSGLVGNVPQVVSATSEYAVDSTKLSEVAGSSLKDTKYTLQYKDIDGTPRTATINFYGDNPADANGNLYDDVANPHPSGVPVAELRNRVTITLDNTSPNAATPTVEIPLYRPLDNNSMPPPDGVTVQNITPDDITYRQLSDAIGVILNGARNLGDDLVDADIGNAATTAQQKKDAYERLLVDSQSNLNVGVNLYGQLEIKDNTHAPSLMSFSMSETQRQVTYMNVNGTQQTYLVNGSSDYSNVPPATRANAVDIFGNPLQAPASTVPYREGAALTFNSNNALVLDDPHVNIFQQIDAAIEAIELAIYRAGDVSDGAYNDSLRSVGMQGGKQWLEHVEEQIIKVHTKVGAQGNAFSYEIERAETLLVQTKELRSDAVDADIPETYAYFVQLTMNYQALLSATAKINQLSLVNYI